MNNINTSSMPPEIMTQIFETLHANLQEKASAQYSSFHPIDQKNFIGRDVAKDFVSLKLVNSEFMKITNNVLNQHEYTELAATKNSIQHLANEATVTQLWEKRKISSLGFRSKLDQPMFRQHMARLVQEHKHISVPFKALDLLQSQIVLEELSRAPSDHLSKLVLDFSNVPRNTWEVKTDLAGKLNSTINHISQNQGNCQIQLSLCRSNISPATLVSTLTNLSNTKVHKLDLSANDLGSSHQLDEALATAIKSPQLTTLYLRYAQLNSSQIQSISKALPQSRLSELHMGMNKISSEAMNELSRNLPGTQLKSLTLMGCSIKDRDIQFLAETLPNTQLEILDLGNNQTEDQGGIAIAQALPKCKLNHLDLRLNSIGSFGGTAIAEALPDCSLSSLNLVMNNLRDEGVLAFARNLSHCKKLKSLDLNGNKVFYAQTIRYITHAKNNSPYPLELDI